jgi:hypothetical protein
MSGGIVVAAGGFFGASVDTGAVTVVGYDVVARAVTMIVDKRAKSATVGNPAPRS